MKCFLGFHQWGKTKVQHYTDISYGAEAKSTAIIKICQRCQKLVRKDYYGSGFLTAEELGL